MRSTRRSPSPAGSTPNRLVPNHPLHQGTLNASHIRVGEGFREPIRRSAAAIIVAHRHPSGDPTPLPEDMSVTRQLARREGARVGHVAELALGELRADRAILEVAGISLPDGITGESLSSTQFTRTVIERMPETIVIADEHKWGRVGPAFLAPLEAIDRIVTSQHAPPAMIWDLSQLGIQIIQV